MPRRLSPLVWGIAFGGLYLLGLARTPQWADASKLTLYALDAHFPSFNPGDHPGWSVLAWLWLRLFPGNPVLACHLLSGLLAGCSVGLLARLLETRRLPPKAVAGTVLVWGLTHGPWWAAEVAETYSLASALVLGCLLAQEKEKQLLAGFFAGWAVAAHRLTILLTAPVLVRKGGALVRILAFAVASSPLWLAGFIPSKPDPLTGFFSGGTASVFWHWDAFVSLKALGTGAVRVLALVSWNLGPVGVWAFMRRSTGTRSGLRPVVFLGLFLTSYAPFRLHLMVASLLLALLLWRPLELDKRQALAHTLIQGALYLVIPALISYFGYGSLGVRPLPGRNNASYFLNPMKAHEQSALTYTQELFATAPRGAVVVADFNPGATLKLRQRVEGIRPDLVILPTAVDNTLATDNPEAKLADLLASLLAQGKRVVLADTYDPYYHLAGLQARGFTLRPCGPGVLVEQLSR